MALLADVHAQAPPTLEREPRDQQDYLRDKLAPLTRRGPMPRGPMPVRLFVLDAELAVTSADLERWARDSLVTSCRWTVRGDDDPAAPLRMLLRRPDGTWSPGAAG